jgi:hypothetical protein
MTIAHSLLDTPEAERFIHLLYPDGGPDGAYLVLTHIGTSPVSEWLTLPDVGQKLAPWLETYSPRFNTYYGLGLRDPRSQSSQKRRGGKKSVCTITGFVFDADDLRGKHKQGALPANEHETLAFIHTLPWCPSIVVDSGGGTHFYWLFETPIIIESEHERDTFEELSKRFRAHIKDEAKKRHGWDFDTLSHIDIILRLPGSLNHKTGTPVPVSILHESGDRYTLEGFERALPSPAQQEKRTQRGRETTRKQTAASGTPTSHIDITVVAKHYGAELTLKSEYSGEYEGAHPQHGSTTGDNLNVQPSLGLWHCFRCDSGGDALSLIAVCEGLIACEDTRSGVFKGKQDLFRQVVAIANRDFGAGINWRPARRVVMRGPIKTYNVSEVCLKTTSVKTR